MKALKKFFMAAIFLLSLAVVGCGGDGDSEKTDDEGDGIFTAEIGAIEMTSRKSEARAVLTKHPVASSVSYSFYVQGLDNDKRMIHFTIRNATVHETGTHPISFISNNAAYYIENFDEPNTKVWLSPYGSDVNAEFGEVIITEISENRTKGTFSFTAQEDGDATLREVTSGTFDVPMTRQGF